MLQALKGRCQNCEPEVLETVLEIALSLARRGSEGKSIGALFVIGDSDAVLRRSKPLILDPLEGYPREKKDIRDANVQGTINELAKMDGAFVISADGYVLSATRYIETIARFVDLPLGFGSRHMAAASISKETGAVAVVVSESDGIVRLFDDGELIAEFIPWVGELERVKPRIEGEIEKIVDTTKNVTVMIKKSEA
ncbi:MAG: DNA integrity scanning protein DisA nucleotide-binding domain protein [Candidatus Methanospirareceae archaeon]